MGNKPFFGKRFGFIFMAFILVFQLMAGTVTAAENSGAGTETNIGAEQIQKTIDLASDYLAKSSELSDWGAIALALAGKEVPAGYLTNAKQILSANDGDFSKVTDAERMALAIDAVGEDPTKFAGVNLIEKIVNHERLTKQGTNGPIYALLVLGSGNYSLPDNAAWNQDKLIAWILEQQNQDGGWSLVSGSSSSVDITAMALSSLAPYKGKADMDAPINKAAAWLSANQQANGGFRDSGENSESVSQVITALTALGIDPTGEAFAKAEGNALSHLLTFQQNDGGFAHAKGYPSNGMATEQALQAFVAYQMFSNGQGGLYEAIVDVQVSVDVEGNKGAVAEGNTKASNAMEALELLLKKKSIPYKVTSSSFGSYISSIGGIDAGLYGGFDGWMFSVLRDGEWLFPAVGMSDFALEEGDQVVVYYGDGTQLIEQISIQPQEPKANRAFKVKIQQAQWNWTDNKQDVSPAAGVAVQIGEQIQTADEQGIAAFESGFPEGEYTVAVTGYSDNKAPTVVRRTEKIRVVPAEVQATVQVEGPQKSIAKGRVKAANALEAFEQLLTKENIVYNVKSSSFGKYVSAVDGIEAGLFGGYDGWMFAVLRDGERMIPMVGMADFELEKGDRIIVYYGDGETRLVHSMKLKPEQPEPNEPFEVSVTKAQWNWTDNKLEITPAAGASVKVGDQIRLADEAGKAVFEAGVSQGTYKIEVSGYVEGAAPNLLKAEETIAVYSDYVDLSDISSWALPSVNKAGTLGFMIGLSAKESRFAPQQSMTRAEFAALLIKLLQETPLHVDGNVYGDVKADSWYSGYIAKAKQLGFIDGTAASFFPNRYITREEMAVMAARALQLAAVSKQTGIKDIGAASAYAIHHIEAVYESGLMVGSGGYFAPKSHVSRETAAILAVRIYQLLQ